MDIVSQTQAARLEGYAQALQDLLLKFTKKNDCGNNLPALTVDIPRAVLVTPAYDLASADKEQGFDLFTSVEEVESMMLEEVCTSLEAFNEEVRKDREFNSLDPLDWSDS